MCVNVGRRHLRVREILFDGVEKVSLLGTRAGVSEQYNGAVLALEAIERSADVYGHLVVAEGLHLHSLALRDDSRHQVQSKEQHAVVELGKDLGSRLWALEVTGGGRGSASPRNQRVGLLHSLGGPEGGEPPGKCRHLIWTPNPVMLSRHNKNGNRCLAVQEAGNLTHPRGGAHADRRVLEISKMGDKLGVAGDIQQVLFQLFLCRAIAKGCIGCCVKGNLQL
mmetsp:Transcript_25927/g.60842  ORF Transcript_25927/g.60842 Transcript_25927/m.60842 type:complete len:223 (-) Transcript_25927:1667-2335(-)